MPIDIHWKPDPALHAKLHALLASTYAKEELLQLISEISQAAFLEGCKVQLGLATVGMLPPDLGSIQDLRELIQGQPAEPAPVVETAETKPDESKSAVERQFLSLSRQTAMTLRQRDDLRAVYGGPAENGKYRGFIMTEPDSRPLVSSEPVFNSADAAVHHMRELIALAKKDEAKSPRYDTTTCNMLRDLFRKHVPNGPHETFTVLLAKIIQESFQDGIAYEKATRSIPL